MGMKCLAQGHNTAPQMRIEPAIKKSDAFPTELSVLPVVCCLCSAIILKVMNFGRIPSMYKVITND